MKRLLYIPILCFVIILSYACDKKKEQSLKDMGLGDDENGQSMAPSIGFSPIYGFSFWQDNAKKEYTSYTVFEPVITLETVCFGVFTTIGARNQQNDFYVERTDQPNLNCDLPGMELVEGDNLIKGIIRNVQGFEANDWVMITYNKTVDFKGAITFSPIYSEEGKPKEIQVSIHINPETVPDSARLFYDKNGQRTYIPINFSYDNASELYTGSFNTVDMKEGRYSVRIEARKDGHENLSSIEYFTVLASEIDKKIKQDSDLARSISEKYFNQYEGDTFEDVIKYREWVAEEIKNTPGLIKAKVAKNGDFVMQFKHLGYSVTVDERFRHGAHLMENEEVDIPVEASQAPVTPMTTEDKEKYKEIYRKMIKNTPLSNLITDNDTIHSTKVLMLSPMYHDFGGSDAYSNIFPILRDSAYPTFNGSQNMFDIDVYLNENATVDRFRNMHEYGIIILDTHGGYEDGVYTFATGEKTSPALDLKYQYELDNHFITKGQVKSFYGLIAFGPEYYIVKDAFLLQNRNIFPNSFVFFSSCSSSAKVMDHLDKMGQMFIKNNRAGMYLGFSDTVPVLYSGYLGKILFSNLVNGDTAITAIDKTKKNTLLNINRYSKLLTSKGNNNLKIVDRSLKNGGFEDGTAHWQSNAVINISDYMPPTPEGSKRIITADENGYISQTFKIPDNTTILSFSYLNFSETNASCNGAFKATIMDNTGKNTDIAEYNYANILSETRIENDDPYFGTAQRPNQNDAWYKTDWKKAEYPVSSFAGQIVTLKFTLNYTMNVNYYDICRNEIQIDDVKLY